MQELDQRFVSTPMVTQCSSNRDTLICLAGALGVGSICVPSGKATAVELLRPEQKYPLFFMRLQEFTKFAQS